MSTEQQAIYKAGITPGIGLISGPEGQAARREALEKDEDVSYRVVINIVGKERQGKTSLRRLLTYEPFNIHEESTVGIEHEMVDTKGVTESWASVSIKDTNLNEYNLVLGQCVRQRLTGNPKGSGSFYLTHVILFLKIAGVSYLTLWLYFTLLYSDALTATPWIAGLLVMTFSVSAMTFDVKDGLGIAVGIVALILHCDALQRWKPTLDSYFKSSHDSTMMFVPYLQAYIVYCVLDLPLALPLGASLGKGLLFVLCLSRPPPPKESSNLSGLYNPHIHIFAIFTLVGIATYNFRRFKYFVLLPSTAVLVTLLPQEYLCTVFSGLGCGQSHMLFLRTGQNCYLAVNTWLKRFLPCRWQRRLLVDIVGIFPGVLAMMVFGWDLCYYFSLSHLFSGLFFVASIHFINKMLAKSSGESSSTKSNKASDILVTRLQMPCVKLIIKDFAGHPLYHCTHHIYMGGHAVYLCVFSLLDAKADYKAVLSQLIGWIQSIYTHAHFAEVPVLLVGTHRDSKRLALEDRHVIGKQLREDIPHVFHKMLVWNKNDVPLFAVENSLRDETDADHKVLRETLIDIAKNASFRKKKWPVRYLAFYDVIESFRNQGDVIQDISAVFDKTKKSECEVHTLSDLEDLLLYFSSVGEIMYNVKDNRLKDLVVFDPRVIVQIMGAIVTIPQRHQRSREVFNDWTRLAESGVSSEKLFSHVLKEVAPNIYNTIGPRKIALLFEKYDLLCKVSLPPRVQRLLPGEHYLIPACLTFSPRLAQTVWQTQEDDDVFYADFGLQNVSPIYLRLVCQCSANHDVSVTTDGMELFNIDQHCALFNFGETHSYKLELCKGYVESSGCRELLRITVRSWSHVGCLPLIKELNSRLMTIVHSNFDKCCYSLRVQCPCEAPHNLSEGKKPALLRLTCSVSKDSELFPDRKEFVCCGRKVVVESGKVRIDRPGRKRYTNVSNLEELDLQTNVLDLQENVYRHLCSSLNRELVLANDWKGLAGALGFSHREVELMSDKPDPCNELFKEWSASGSATLATLIRKLEEIQRQDLVTYLQDRKLLRS
ncbi:uncharacterized protein LOC135472714 [Liolophura sinensis]|uniref:uncharacterized protein LOC135472714 n=1 Tax=Liolophura sinensis TaxID=3198878 RepID=UPI003157F218